MTSPDATDEVHTTRGVVAWLTDDTWTACIDTLARIPGTGAVTLLYVTDTRLHQVTHGAMSGLLGRGRHKGSEEQLARVADHAARALLNEARDRFGRAAELVARTGRPEREVVTVARDATLLICARDGDRSRLGPASLGRELRFVVDHAPCPVLLIWPDAPPDLASIPPPPQPRPGQSPRRPGSATDGAGPM